MLHNTHSKNLLLWFISGLCLLFPNILPAQKFSLKHITVSDGLPSNETFCLWQKGVGELYIGTEYGMVQYDGEEFRQVPFENKKYSGAMVFEIKPDRQNVLWVKTYRDGLFYLKNDTLRPFVGNDNIKAIIKENMLGELVFDNNSNLWFTLPSYYDTVFKVSIKTGKATKIPVKPPAGKHLQIQVYYIDSTTSLVVNTNAKSKCSTADFLVKENNKNIYITPGTEACRPFGCRPETFVKNPAGFSMALHSDLLQWNYSTGNHEIINLRSEILYLLNDNPTNLLIACKNGAYLLNKNTWKVKPIIENQQVTSILQDSEGTYWFTTNNGLVNMPSTDIYLLNLTEPGYNILTIAGNMETGRLAAVSIGGTLSIYSDKNYAVTLDTYYEKKLDRTFPKKMLWFNNQMLIYSHAYYDNAQGTEKTLSESLKGAILDIEKGEAKNTVWYAYKKGIRKFTYADAGKGKASPLFCPELFCRAVFELNSNIYIGTDLGLYLFDGEKSYRRIFPDEINFQVNDIKSAGKSRLLVATRGGGVFIVEGETIRQLSVSDGLSSNFCTRITVEEENTIWAGSNKGLNRIKINPDGFTINRWYTEDGLISDKVNDLAWTGNNLYILTDQGINYFNPKKITATKPLLFIYLRDLKINGTSRVPADNKIDIKPGERDLRFEFKTLGFRKGKNIQLRYTLQGEDQILSQTGGQSIIYKDLSPGAYTLRVQVIGAEGKEGGAPLTYTISVEPYFYETRLFWVLLIVFFAGLAILLVVLFLRRSEKERKRKWEYANAQLEALNLQMNPHFIFNALGNIQSLVFGDNKMLTNNFVVGLSELFRKVLINANTNLITLGTETEMLKEYIELELLRIEEASIEYTIEVDPQLALSSERIPPLLVQPIVENAIWHGLLPAGRKGILKISFIKTAHGFEIEVVDNGVGINAGNTAVSNKKRRPSLGLDNVKKRIILYKTMKFGTAKMFVDDLKNIPPYNTGTRVVLSFENKK